MTIYELVSTVHNHGYELIPAGDKVKYRGNGSLPEEVLSELKSNKQEVIQYLTAKEKLITLAEEFNWSSDDLLDWYKSDLDMKDIARLDIPQLRTFVKFYLENHDQCRRQS